MSSSSAVRGASTCAGLAVAAGVLAGVGCGFPEPTFEPASDASIEASTPDGASPDAIDDDVSQETLGDVGPDGKESGTDTGDDGGCTSGFKQCSGSCVQISDPAWGCSATSCAACNLANASADCQSNACAIDTCTTGWLDCDSDPKNGCEAAPASDKSNCGACGNVCSFAHATALCNQSTCQRGACDSGFEDCDGDPKNGCEGDLQSDPKHCGACANLCPSAGGTPICSAGQCGFSSCTPPLEDCDKDPAHTCETDLSSSLANCSFCGHACAFANAVAVCSSSSCVLDHCNGGFGNCDSDDANGCETSTNTSVQHCGLCNHKCPSPVNSTGTCNGGACGFQCTGSYADCNKSVTDGCEVDTSTDPANCGACNFACALSHATAGCASQQCTIAQCAAGYGNCDGNVANGCEANLTNDAAHCGSCATACTAPANADPKCAGSSCGFVCKAGWVDCDGVASNGCEKAKLNYALEVAADGPVGWWRLGETSGNTAADATGHGHTGVYVGATLGVPGAIACDQNKAVQFVPANDSRVMIPRDVAFEPATTLTLELWFKQTAAPTQYEKMLWYGDPSSAPWGSYGFERSDTTATIFTFFTAPSPSEGWTDVTGLAKDVWYHLVATYDGVNQTVYLNGAQFGQNPLTGPIRYDKLHGLVIGGAGPQFDLFSGTLDEVAVYDKVLTGARILVHYKAGTP